MNVLAGVCLLSQLMDIKWLRVVFGILVCGYFNNFNLLSYAAKPSFFIFIFVIYNLLYSLVGILQAINTCNTLFEIIYRWRNYKTNPIRHRCKVRLTHG